MDGTTGGKCRGDILLIPGGKGARRLILQEQDTLRLIKEAAGAAGTVIMVGSGSAVLAQTGALYHRTVAEFAGGDNWKRMFTAGIYWTRIPGGSLTVNFIPVRDQLTRLT